MYTKKKQMSLFKTNVKDFYSLGKHGFLTIDETGDLEFFNTHVLRCYMPQIVKEVYATYGVGLGVFSMKGFEHLNKQSKRMFRNK